MKLEYEQLPIGEGQSFRSLQLDLPVFDAPWHFHPEYELTYIESGTGTRFVGDSIERYASGDFILLGPNLPHYWRSDPETERSKATVIHFSDRAIPAVPELSTVHDLMERSRKGVKFEKFWQPFQGSYVDLLLLLLELSREGNLKLLAENANPKTSERITRACDFIFKHYREPITLDDVSRKAAMSPTAFSRYFKKHVGKPLSLFIAEHRVSEAARQLIGNEKSISEVAFECGFGSLSAFNRHFREFRSMSPSEFRETFKTQPSKTP